MMEKAKIARFPCFSSKKANSPAGVRRAKTDPAGPLKGLRGTKPAIRKATGRLGNLLGDKPYLPDEPPTG
jgi:hypothetical protein